MNKTFEENFEELQVLLEGIEEKLNNRKKTLVLNNKKNSHVHFMINTLEKNKLMKRAEEEGIDFSEWCRRKLKEDTQLNRIENKLDKLIK